MSNVPYRQTIWLIFKLSHFFFLSLNQHYSYIRQQVVDTQCQSSHTFISVQNLTMSMDKIKQSLYIKWNHCYSLTQRVHREKCNLTGKETFKQTTLIITLKRLFQKKMSAPVPLSYYRDVITAYLQLPHEFDTCYGLTAITFVREF